MPWVQLTRRCATVVRQRGCVKKSRHEDCCAADTGFARIDGWSCCPSCRSSCRSMSCWSVSQREAFAALDPFLGRENSRRKFNQAREHIEDGHRAPFSALARTIALAGKLFGDFCERNILDDQLHHGEQELHFVGIFFRSEEHT